MQILLVLLSLLGLGLAQNFQSACYNVNSHGIPVGTPEYIIRRINLGSTSYYTQIDAYPTDLCNSSQPTTTFILNGVYTTQNATATVYQLSNNATVSGVSNIDVTWNTTANSITVITAIGEFVTGLCNTTGTYPIAIQNNMLTDITQYGCPGLGIPPASVSFYDIIKFNGDILWAGYNTANLYTPTSSYRSTQLNDINTLPEFEVIDEPGRTNTTTESSTSTTTTAVPSSTSTVGVTVTTTSTTSGSQPTATHMATQTVPASSSSSASTLTFSALALGGAILVALL